MTGYADDVTYSKPLFSDNDIETAYADLDLICQWIGSHDLRLNLKKVKAMVISRKKLPPQPLLQICGEQIEFVSSFKLLGVIVTNNLSWTPHIMFSISKAKCLIGFLFRVFKEADEPFLSKLYKAIVLPHLEYCSCVWDPPFTKYITALERVQSFAAHVVTNTWPLESAPLVESLQWPSLSQRRYFQKLCLCRRILCGFSIIPPSFFPLSTRPLSSHKNSFPLYHSFVRTHHHKSSFKHSVVSIVTLLILSFLLLLWPPPLIFIRQLANPVQSYTGILNTNPFYLKIHYRKHSHMQGCKQSLRTMEGNIPSPPYNLTVAPIGAQVMHQAPW